MINININIMTHEDTFVTPRGGPARLFGLPWGFTPNRCLSPQKKQFRTWRTPFIEKIERRNLEKSTFSKKKFEKILKGQKFR